MNSRNPINPINTTTTDNRLHTGIGPMTDKILNSILDRVNTDSFREKLSDKIVDPVTQIINDKIRPYVYVSLTMYAIIVILLIIIIYMLYKKKGSLQISTK